MGTSHRRFALAAFILLVQWIVVTPCAQGSETFEVSGYSLAVNYLPDLLRASGDVPSGGVEVGADAIQLKGMKSGAYLINSHSYSFKSGDTISLSFSMHGNANGAAQVSVFVNEGYRKKLIAKKSCQLAKGKGVIRFTTPKGKGNANVWFSVRVPARKAVTFSNFSFSAKRIPDAVFNFQDIGIEYDAPMGVFRQGQTGRCALNVPNLWKRAIVIVTDVLSGKVVLDKTIELDRTGNAALGVPTAERGYYLLSVFIDDGGNREEIGSSPYVVLKKDPIGGPRDARFGLCLDEFPKDPVYPAGISQNELYAVYRDMGVGAVRLYSPAKPVVLSEDGVEYDFTAFESSLKLAEKNDFAVLVPMGSGLPSNVPDWLRTDLETGNVSLIEGLLTKRLKNMAKKGSKTFIDMDSYRQYLERVFRFMEGRVQLVEVWNEPGHKFSPADTIKLAKAAMDTKKKLGCSFSLLGYSSTKGGGTGQGEDPAKVPGFLEDVMRLGGGELVDGISYHSGHAFRFMGESHDPRDHETGYPARMRRVVQREGRSFKIWDTERGSPWNSRYIGAVLRRGGSAGPEHDNQLDIHHNVAAMQAAKQLPMIYSAAIFDEIETVFWFHGNDALAQDNSRLVHRWGLFDVLHQPGPQIVAYDFMAEVLGHARSARKVDDESGLRAYVYSKGEDAVVVAYNWRDKTTRLSVVGYQGQWSGYDVFGRKVAGEGVLSISDSPVYLLLPGIDATKVSFEKMQVSQNATSAFQVGVKK